MNFKAPSFTLKAGTWLPSFSILLNLFTLHNNFDSCRLRTQEIPSLTSVQAAIVELNARECQLSCICVVVISIQITSILKPSDDWLWKALCRAIEGDIPSLHCGKARRRQLYDLRHLYHENK